MTERYKIQRMANITAPDGTEPVFYEIHTVITVDGVETVHRNADLTFETYDKAAEWVSNQD